MSTIYVFQNVEPTVTSTTTSIIAPSDPVLINSSSQGSRAAQSTVGSISACWNVSTSTSTGTALLNYGTNFITSSSTVPNWTLTTPTRAGQCVAIFNGCTTTATSTWAITVASSGCVILSTETSTGLNITLGARNTYIDLQAVNVSTSFSTNSTPLAWAVIGRSAFGTSIT